MSVSNQPESELRSNLGAIILAAGQSSRMGRIKQLLPWRHTTLLRHTVNQIKGAGIEEIQVILGANAEQIKKEDTLNDVQVVINKNWKQGMGTSISKGMSNSIRLRPKTEAVLIAVIDQPLLEVVYYKKLIDRFINTNYKIVSSSYSEQFGVPVIFSRIFFDELLKLRGDRGAKSLLRKHSDQIASVKAGNLAIDLDNFDKYSFYYAQYGNI